MHIERERQFCVLSIPFDLDDYPSMEIIQGYVAVEESGREVRVRRKGEDCFITVKTPKDEGLTREEVEGSISYELFELLWPLTVGRRIEKTRYFIPYSNKIIEFDIYSGKLTGFMSAEIEFESAEESRKFITPEWFGPEVTNDKRFKNYSLAIHGLPE